MPWTTKNFWIGVAVGALALLLLHIGTGASYAADLGGNCCADLEERIAELEATTARKGNRKVSLTVSGWVAEQVTYWDDGVDTNTYVGGVGRTLSSHFKFTGEALVNQDFSAGYVLHVEVVDTDALKYSQLDSSGGGSAVEAFQSYWFLKYKPVGKLSVGKQSGASDNAAVLVDGSGSLVPANWILFDNSSFFLRGTGANGTWGDLGYCRSSGAGLGGDCTAGPQQLIRFDSRELEGVAGKFSVSAAWGADDFWDAAARYSNDFQGFKIAAVASFARTEVEGLPNIDYSQAGVYIENTATGLFGYGAYGLEKVDGSGQDGKRWYVKAGAREKWSPLGHTVLYGEYGQAEDMQGPGLDTFSSQTNVGLIYAQTKTFRETATDSELTQYGLGVVQEIDQAAMSIWLSWRHYEGEYSGTTQATCSKIGFGGPSCAGLTKSGTFASDLEDFEVIKAGALINF